MTLESALTYLVALALPVWLVAEQVMIRLGRAQPREARAESAAGPSVTSSGAAANPVAGTTAPALTRKAA